LASKVRAISDFYFELPNFGASPWFFDRFLGPPRLGLNVAHHQSGKLCTTDSAILKEMTDQF
jgi:hypothetical protein